MERMNLKLKLYSSFKFWKFLDKWKQKEFIFKRRYYSFQDKIFALRVNFNISRTYWKLSIFQILKSVLFVIFFLVIEGFLIQFGKQNWNNLPNFIQRIYLILPVISETKDYSNLIIPFLSIIASVNGLILALFFPIITSIITAAFVKVPGDVRFLLLKEPNTQNFIKNITFILSLSILSIFSIIIDHKPEILILSLITLLSLRGFYYLIKIGFGIFQYFDPSSLTKIIIQDIYKNFQYATVKGRYYKDKNFQHNYYLYTYKSIEQLKILIGIITQENFLQSSSFRETINSILVFLEIYQENKYNIPLDSLWFQKTVKHQSPFTTNYFKKQLSLEFDTIIQPEQVSDFDWIEKSLINLIFDGLNDLSGDRKFETIYLILNNLGNISEKIGLLYNINLLGVIILKCNQLIINLFPEKYNDEFSNNIDLSGQYMNLGILECYFKIYQRFELGMFKKCILLENTNFRSLIDNLHPKFNKLEGLNINSIVPSLKTSLLKIKELIDNEKSIEGKIVTPSWFIIQYAASDYILDFKNVMDKLSKSFELYSQTISFFETNNNKSYASFCQLLGIENLTFQNKHFERTFEIIRNFDVLKKNVDTTWIPLNFDIWTDNFTKIRISYLVDLSGNLLYLTYLKKSDELPDIFGQAYSIISKELNEAMFYKNSSLFSTLFNTFLPSAIIAAENLLKEAKVKDQSIDWQIKVSNQTIFDLLDICGIALIYSELYNDDSYKMTIFSTWDRYFELMNSQDPIYERRSIESFVLRYSMAQNHLYGMDLNFEQKELRKQLLRRKFKELHLISEFDIFNHKLEIKKNDYIIDNPLLELICPRDEYFSFYYDFSEIFLELFLLCRLSSKDINVGYRKSFLNGIILYCERKERNEKS